MEKTLTEILETGTPEDFPLGGMIMLDEWIEAQKIWRKFKENLADNLRIEGLTESDEAIKEAVDDCVVTAYRTVHGNACIFIGSKGADPGPEIYCWLDENGELRAEENLDESEIDRDVEHPEFIDR